MRVTLVISEKLASTKTNLHAFHGFYMFEEREGGEKLKKSYDFTFAFSF